MNVPWAQMGGLRSFFVENWHMGDEPILLQWSTCHLRFFIWLLDHFTDFIIVKFKNFDFLKVPYFCRINSGPIFYMSKSFFGQTTTKNLFLCSWEITKKSLCWKLLKIFHFSTVSIWLFGIFDKRPQGCDQVKNSMGLLQGPRLMA
jgi:hypothetical protein